jgi:hypothetical protein
MNTLAQELRPFPYLGLAPRGNPIEAHARIFPTGLSSEKTLQGVGKRIHLGLAL